MNKFIEQAEIEMQMSIEQPTGSSVKRARSQNAEDKEKVAQAMESIPPITLRVLCIQDKSCYAKDNLLKFFTQEYGDGEDVDESKEEEKKTKSTETEEKEEKEGEENEEEEDIKE